ncbi:MAG: CDP-alcohol phosphatidyltransferase family protein [Candidatus Riflebacteria bacterium]|nr:CDP-alcohol phosphatidyltransferase family protein [Candidatus Riflebacteria bacterium]
MTPYNLIRKQQYEYNRAYAPYLSDWKKNPYTFIKSIFYMETGAILVFLLLKTKIKPNTVTLAYCLCGIIGGILLSIPSKVTVILSTIIFFFKGILDWSDGHFARLTNQTSATGQILDEYGALLNELGLQIGLGFYIFNKSHDIFFLIVLPLIPFFCAANLMSFSKRILFENMTACASKKNPESNNSNVKTNNASDLKENRFPLLKKIYILFTNIFDERARSEDFICFCILFEIFSTYFFTWIIFIILLIRGVSIFLVSFIIVYHLKWAEKKASLMKPHFEQNEK